MAGTQRRRQWALKAALAAAFCTAATALEAHHNPISKPQYHYGAKIPVTCLDRSMYVLQIVESPLQLQAH
jgi:hypothetical protein